jgi:hypothetical protein
MSAIERYYATLSPPAGPYYAGDEEDDDNEMSDEELAIAYEVAMQDF